MKLVIKKKRSFNIILPNFCLKILFKYIKTDDVKQKEMLNSLTKPFIKELKKYKRINKRKIVLIEIESKDGEVIKIIF